MKRLTCVMLACAAPAMAGERLDREINEIDADSLISSAPARQSVLTTSNGSFGVNLNAARQEAAQESSAKDDGGFFFTRHSGMYFRASGLVVNQLNDVRDLNTGAQIGFDPGFGLTLAGGYRDMQYPIAFEVEYAYRQVDAIDDSDGRYTVSTLTANVLFDASDILGPVGVYAGGGLGITIDEVRASSGTGGGTLAINSNRFFWQLMAGVTLSVSNSVQLYAGGRYTSAGTYEDEDENFRWHSDAVNGEFGIRIFF